MDNNPAKISVISTCGTEINITIVGRARMMTKIRANTTIDTNLPVMIWILFTGDE